MKYNVNPAIFGNTYAIPADVADKYLKIATHTQIKVLLYFMRNISQGIDTAVIAAALSLAENEVDDALLFWSQCGMLSCENKQEQKEKTVIVTSTMPTRADVIKRGLEDERLMFLLREAQLKFGRNLKQNESSLLVSLYDDHGMDASVILLLLGYAAREGKCNISFVKKTATHWLESGVETVIDAERLIADAAKQNLAWQIVQNAFGIEKRNPSTKELEYSNRWINEWKISGDLLKAAYDVCIDANAKLSMAYVAKVLERWHKAGYTTPADTVAENKAQPTKKKTSAKNDFAGYDLDLYEKMLNDKISRKD